MTHFLSMGDILFEVATADLSNMKKHLNKNSTVIMDDVYCNKPYCKGPNIAWRNALKSNDLKETFTYSSESKSRGFATARFNSENLY